jgi:calcium-dependent protein kinase
MEKEQKQQLIEIFKALDTNGDGVLSKYEIVSGLERLMGVEAAKEEAAKIFRQVDLDNSGYLDYAEFTLACVDHKQCLSEEKLRQAFEHFDKDGNGSISIKEIEEGLAGIEKSGDINWEEIMKDVDRDRDGEVSFEEFKMMMIKLS